MDSLNLADWQWFDLDICQAKPMSCRKPKRTTWESLKTRVANNKTTRLINFQWKSGLEYQPYGFWVAESVEIDCRYWTNSFIPVIAHTWMHCRQAVCLTEQQPSRQMCSHVKLRWCHFPWVMSLLQLYRHSADSKKEKSPISHFFLEGWCHFLFLRAIWQRGEVRNSQL